MSYKAITSPSSAQYKLIHSDEITVCDDGLLRDHLGYIGVAMGSYYSKHIGERFIITLEDGREVKVITLDAKSNAHTINGANHKGDGSMIEFVIDIGLAKKCYSKAILTGNFNNTEEFGGNIIKIEKVIKEQRWMEKS